jgi:cellulose biosynthesis protein BcsQ
MASIAIYSVKGGVGKTTFAANLGYSASLMPKQKILVWDLDPANGSGFLLGVKAKKRKAASGAFTKAIDPAKLIRKTAYKGLHVLPADESLRLLDRDLAKLGGKKRLEKLVARLSKYYDRIIFDCPPVMNEVSAQVIRAADLIIVPVPPSPLSRRALEMVVHAVEGSRKRHPPILPVLSMMDMRRTLHRAVRDGNPNWPAVPFAAAIEQCAVRQEPVATFAPQSPAARAFAQLWGAIERKLESQ